MRHLTKGAQPGVLTRNAAKWTKAIKDRLDAHLKPTKAQIGRYRNVEIKDSLVQETGGKCAYCEAKLLHIHHGDVEHIYPKSLDPLLTVEWDNLTLACEICNQNKTNHDPNLLHIIDPYKVDPRLHLKFIGPFVFSTGTPEGTSTRELLQLHRPELVERRKDEMERLEGVFKTIENATVPAPVRKSILQNLLDTSTSLNAQYSEMNRAILLGLMTGLPVEVTQGVVVG